MHFMHISLHYVLHIVLATQGILSKRVYRGRVQARNSSFPLAIQTNPRKRVCRERIPLQKYVIPAATHDILSQSVYRGRIPAIKCVFPLAIQTNRRKKLYRGMSEGRKEGKKERRKEGKKEGRKEKTARILNDQGSFLSIPSYRTIYSERIHELPQQPFCRLPWQGSPLLLLLPHHLRQTLPDG